MMMNLAKYYAQRRRDGNSFEFSDDSESIYRSSDTVEGSSSSSLSSEKSVGQRSKFLSTSNGSISTLPELIVEPYERKTPEFLENIIPEYIRGKFQQAKRVKMDEENFDLEVYAFCKTSEAENLYRFCAHCTELKRKKRRLLFVKNAATYRYESE
ncbi:uncharacterized protein LOC143917162 [Arctopsyche grandis]|uniref:uncharacterized protein LOC143917162 n=1 Tax=Arctopsyche grandis TaxID=121162 RepID=UPI00406DA1F5